MIRITIVERPLGDHSKVYDVELGNVTLPAVSFEAAMALALGLGNLISQNTNDKIKHLFRSQEAV